MPTTASTILPGMWRPSWLNPVFRPVWSMSMYRAQPPLWWFISFECTLFSPFIARWGRECSVFNMQESWRAVWLTHISSKNIVIPERKAEHSGHRHRFLIFFCNFLFTIFPIVAVPPGRTPWICESLLVFSVVPALVRISFDRRIPFDSFSRPFTVICFRFFFG